MVHLVCARTTTRTTMQLSSLIRTGTTSKWFATNPRPNQSMKPTAPLRYNFSVFATTPCRGLFLAREADKTRAVPLVMARNYRLLFGPLAGVILAFGIAGLALLIPGY